ncbi:MAG: Crp/Fnr family transcriptional regulator [Desulfovibrionaceae bacterium]|nr:Crp/Fnr family transcriptional regulator [Desulfovibrionaceae bacterium]
MEYPAQFFYQATMPESESAIVQVLSLGTECTFPKNYDMYADDSNANCFFYIASGSVSIYHDMPDGKSLHILRLGRGNLFGISGAIAYRFTTFRCFEVRYHTHTEVRLWKFSGDMLRDPQFIAEHPDIISEILLQQSIKTFMMHSAFTQANSEAVHQSFCRFALRLYKEKGSREIHLGITQTELAARFGVHRTTLNRAIRKLKELGIIASCTRDGFVIGDLERLRLYAAGGEGAAKF